MEATNVNHQATTGWFIAGSHPQDYTIGIDRTVRHGGEASGYIQSRPSQQEGSATLMQNIKADDYRGRRIRLSGYVKGEKITKWAGLWMRADSAQGDMLSF